MRCQVLRSFNVMLHVQYIFGFAMVITPRDVYESVQSWMSAWHLQGTLATKRLYMAQRSCMLPDDRQPYVCDMHS
jgi:hypothetical protein